MNILERTNRMVVRNIDDVMLSIGLTQDMIKNLPQKSKDDYKMAKQIYSVDINYDNCYVYFQEASNGDFYGSAGVFKLPIDMDVSSSTTGRVYHRYKNLKVHYEYKGHYKGSNDNPFINTSATYCHQRLGVDFTPSIEVSFSGYPQIGFGVGVCTNCQYRTVGFDSDIKLKLI